MHLCFVTLLKSNFGMGFSKKFAVYFQNTFSLEQFWSAVSGRKYWEIMRSTVNSQMVSGKILYIETCWTLDVSLAASDEITLVDEFTKFSQD